LGRWRLVIARRGGGVSCFPVAVFPKGGKRSLTDHAEKLMEN
jgi:hypothetical protein